MIFKKVYAICLSLVLLISLASSESKAQADFQLKAQPGCKEIVLTWTPLEGAINYQPYIYLPSGSTYPLIDFPTNSYTFTHKELTDGKEYCYEVVGYNKDLKPIGKTNKVCAKPKCVNCDIILKYTVGKKQYFVNDSPLQMDSEPEIKNNRMFLVISFVTKHIPGTTIDWDGSAQKITITTAEGKIIKLWVGNPKAEVSGIMVDIDPAYPGQGSPYIKDSRTKVPMRFVGNHLNAKVDWDGSTSTVILSVRDTINCGCAWTQKGRILIQNTATKNSIKFDTNCDGAPEATYSCDSNLININPEDGYNGKLGGYMGCATLCIDNNSITKWKAYPNDPDCCVIPCCTFTTTNVIPPALIRELAPGQSYTYKYKFTNTCTSDHLPIAFSFTHREKITSITPDTFTLAPGLSQTIEVLFQMPTNATSDAEVVFSFNINTSCGHNEQISWALRSKSTCCTFTTTNVIPPALIRELAPGQSYTYKYKFTNTCTSDHLPIAFSFTHREKITSITPDTFTLAPGLSQTIEVLFQMPTNATSDAEVVFSFNINTSCGHNEQISWALRSVPLCCDWLFRTKPELKERKLYMCPGETLTVDDYEIFNNCPIGGNALTITISWPQDRGVISVSPKSFTLQPQERMALTITIKMTTSCRPGESVTFPININCKECVKKTVNMVAYCKQC